MSRRTRSTSTARSSGPAPRPNPASSSTAANVSTSTGSTGPFSCTHAPSRNENRIRSASWCSASAASAARNAATSMSSSHSTVTDWSNCAGSVEVSNSHRWIGVSGTGPVTGPCSAATAGVTSPTAAASDATVGYRNRSRGIRLNPACRARDTT